jgi:hypothetical protein
LKKMTESCTEEEDYKEIDSLRQSCNSKVIQKTYLDNDIPTSSCIEIHRRRYCETISIRETHKHQRVTYMQMCKSSTTKVKIRSPSWPVFALSGQSATEKRTGYVGDTPTHSYHGEVDASLPQTPAASFYENSRESPKIR